MFYLLFSVLALIALLLGIALVRTFLLKAPKPLPCKTELTQQELDTCAEKLAAMVQIPTVSKYEHEDLTEFHRLHKVLEELFPRIHQELEKTDLQGTLLYRWAGKDPDKLPILYNRTPSHSLNNSTRTNMY